MASGTPLSSRPLDAIYFTFFMMSADPLISGLMGFSRESNNFLWFKVFIFLEAFFQVPVFIIGMRGLWKDSQSIYPLLLVYGASTATTVLPCLALLLSTPITSAATIAAGIPSVTESQRLLLLSSYVPFFILPVLMTIDMGARIARLLRAGATVMKERKTR